MTTPPSIPVVLFTVADAMARHALPLPGRVTVTDRHGMELCLTTHAELFRWAEHLGLTVARGDSQRYDRDDTPKVLTSVAGTWHGIRVWLVCCEPTTTAPAAMVEAVAG